MIATCRSPLNICMYISSSCRKNIKQTRHKHINRKDTSVCVHLPDM